MAGNGNVGKIVVDDMRDYLITCAVKVLETVRYDYITSTDCREWTNNLSRLEAGKLAPTCRNDILGQYSRRDSSVAQTFRVITGDRFRRVGDEGTMRKRAEYHSARKKVVSVSLDMGARVTPVHDSRLGYDGMSYAPVGVQNCERWLRRRDCSQRPLKEILGGSLSRFTMPLSLTGKIP